MLHSAGQAGAPEHFFAKLEVFKRNQISLENMCKILVTISPNKYRTAKYSEARKSECPKTKFRQNRD